MRLLVTVVRDGGEPHDVVIATDDTATAGDVAEALGATLGHPVERTGDAGNVVRLPGRGPAPVPEQATGTRPPSLWADGEYCDPLAPAATVLRDGARVSVDDSIGPLLRRGEPVGRYELRIAGGPAAGRVVRLGVGATTVGSAPTCTLPVPDPALPPLALRLTIDIGGEARLTAEGGAQVLLDDEAAPPGTPWPLGGVVRAGDTLLVLDEVGEPDAHLSPMSEGGLAYNRPPRLSPLRPRRRLVVPVPPAKGERARFQLLMAVMPLFFGLGMYALTRQLYMLAFCLMSPLMMLGQWISENREGKKKDKSSLKQYRKDLAEHEVRLAALGKEEQRARRADAPDPAEVLLFATGPRRRLWERRLTDPDALLLRIGTGGLESDVELVPARGGTLTDDDLPRPPVLPDVPVTLPFARLGVVGVAGDRARALATARWLTVQAAVLHSPRDLSVVSLSATRAAGAEWTWAHWLPHTSPDQGQDCVALMGCDSEGITRRVSELLTELARRKAARTQQNAMGQLYPDPAVLLVLDGARLLRRVPGIPQLLTEGPQYGIVALCVDEDERLLPEECKAVVAWSPDAAHHVRVRGYGMEDAGDVLADQVTSEWCELLARSLAPVRDVSRDDADAALPASARLLNLLTLPDPTGADVERVWRAGGATTAAPIGVAADGPFVLDIRRDGPHALVAGTTGAGKSELLQTIIASLAVANRPDALNYVLIDYKGGSAFMDCARLPHTVGMVSDLDAHLTERALASLAAELHRRERILFDAAAKDIEDYDDTRRLRPELEPMPRLVLVIDEFASLVAELPDFIAGLVDIARRGRSLGVHLVLATQRPAGVVSADIRANTNLRIALRVTDASESQDVIDAPDAGAIAKSTPGRMYVRSGAQSLVGVQSARIGGRRPATGAGGPRATLLPLSWNAYSRPLPKREQADDDGTMVTDLAVLVDAVRDSAARMGFGEQRSPWLPPLPELVTLDDVAAHAAGPDAGRGDDVAPIPYGLVDLPARQSRSPLALDLVHGEHTLLLGGARSGRSTVLRTLAGSLAGATSPHDVHVYGVDCGSNALLPLMRLPHVGAVVSRDEPDRVRRLIDRLLAEIARRQRLLAMEGASSAAEQRASAAPEERLPWMVLLLDGWEGFASAFENYNYGQLLEAVQRIFREGSAVGLKVVMTADRSGLSGQVSSAFADRLVLRFADPNDYSTAGLQPREVPKNMPPGRALRITDTGVDETQISLLAPDPAGQAQVRALREIAEQARARHRRIPAGRRPLRVDALPTRVTAAEALALDPDFTVPSPLWALLAVGGDELRPVGVDLEENGPGFVIAGPPRSGRSSTLVTATESLLASGVPVVLVTPRRSPLRELEGRPGVLGVLNADSREDDLAELMGKAPDGSCVIVVDDAELLYDTSLDEALEEVVRKAADGGVGVLVAGSTDSLSGQYRGFAVEARKSRNGLLLTPQSPSDGELLGVRLPANSGGGAAGTGLFVTGGSFTPVQAVLHG
ncbi:MULTISPECIES: FtsK/SpoIIIE domain-containing protein [Streptomyces]|uniref:FtsK/SpoIIIE domain-containing protein n=1 Tax=Streptomyces doudnae TaxID=3075536 RepID=A0ABD5EZ53_9ACTN|nr:MULTISPECIES: FtsK/SpoIIIE domain-containing protein [unclassified Streptomyces]MDT0439289.1 FtsK/SpoIIIE domain-containing protein [Streptomyces sp. DSM 41981]MYQ63460.1 cell division protein FtsK [Streptomyces sp. SID4950]SCD58608.1 DNA segregation ATPase FtsK/SpoIIIE, S-DNA-T family [Streptomyces sp. SolWspMP-5a-2]